MRSGAIFLTLLLPWGAFAQTPTPESIIPPKAVTVIVKQPPKSAPPVVTEAPLQALPLDSIGTDMRFGRGLWKGNNFADVSAMLAGINLNIPSVAAHKLLTKLLTAPAVVGGAKEGEWLKTRLNFLLNIGEEKALRDMLAIVPTSEGKDREFVDRLLVEQDLLKLNLDKACEKTTQAIATHDATFWLQANSFCLARAKKTEEAELALRVLHEQDHEENPIFPFEEAVHKILGEKVKISALKTYNLSPLELAVALEAGLTFDTQINENAATPAAARTLALNSKLPLLTRIRLAEMAFRVGILPREELVTLYRDVSFKQDVFDKANKANEYPKNTAEAHALLFQITEKNPGAVAELRQQFSPDLAAALFSAKTGEETWKTLPITNNIRIAAAQKAFALPVDKAVWKSLSTQKENTVGANIAGLSLLKDAAASEHTGEVALRGIALWGADVNSVTLASIIEAYRTVGLEKEASALAREALE